jgi:hypothetical protein
MLAYLLGIFIINFLKKRLTCESKSFTYSFAFRYFQIYARFIKNLKTKPFSWRNVFFCICLEYLWKRNNNLSQLNFVLLFVEWCLFIYWCMFFFVCMMCESIRSWFCGRGLEFVWGRFAGHVRAMQVDSPSAYSFLPSHCI